VRNFRYLFAARAISFFGTNLAPIAVAFAVLGLGGSATEVGLAFAAWTLAQVSTLLIGGVVADRLPRRAVMIGSDTASLCVRFTMGTLLVSGHAEIWELIALQAVGGAAVAFHSPATSGIVPETVPAGQLQQANSYMSIARYAAFPLGAAVGGALVATIGSGWALLLDAATYATSALLLTMIDLPRRATAAATNFIRELREGWNAFTEHTWVWLVNLWIALYFLITYAPFFVLGPYVAKHSMSGASAWAVIVTGEGIGSLLGGIIGLRFLPRRPILVICGVFTVTALQCALLAVEAPPIVIGCGALLAGLAFSYGSIVWETTLQKTIAREKLSRVSAYSWMGAMIFLPAGYAIAGPVADAIGISTSLWIGAAWIVVSTIALVCVPSVRNVSSSTTPVVPDLPPLEEAASPAG